MNSDQTKSQEKTIKKLTAERDTLKEDSYSSTAKIERLQAEKVELEKAVKKLSKESQS